MAAFNHSVRKLDREDHRDSWRNGVYRICQTGRGPNRCHKPATYICEYEYVTGRAGRITNRRIPKCREHAQWFANKHEIAGPDEFLEAETS